MSLPPKVLVEKTFKVSADKVFDAWLDTEKIGRWMLDTERRDEELINLETNPRVGGTFSFVILRDGEELNHRGTYRELDPPKRLVFTWGVNEEAGDESVVSIDIEPADNGCRLTLSHALDPKWAEYVDRTEEGWNLILNKIKEIVE